MNKRNDPLNTSDIGCLEAIETLYAYIDNEIEDEVTLAKMEHHLGHCRSCYSRREMERRLSERIRNGHTSTVPDALKKRMRKLLDDF